MHLSSENRSRLGYLSEGIAILSALLGFLQLNIGALILAIIMGIVGAIFIHDASTTKKRESVDFRNRIVREAVFALDRIATDSFQPDVLLPIWFGKDEDSKADLLGNDYSLLKACYDALERHDKYLVAGSIDFSTLHGLERECINAFSMAFEKIPWLKSNNDFRDALLKAKERAKILP